MPLTLSSTMSTSTLLVPVEGIFVDPVFRKKGTIKLGALNSSIERVVGTLGDKLVQDVNDTFDLNGATVLNAAACTTRIYPRGML